MSKKKTHKEFIQELKDKNPNIIAIGVYRNTRTPIEVKCKICGYIWKTAPYHLIASSEKRRTGCKICKRKELTEKQRMSRKEIRRRIKTLTNNEYDVIDWLGQKSHKDKIKILHKKCGYEFEMTINNFLRGQRCPKHKYENLPQKFTKKSHEYYKKRIMNECPDYSEFKFQRINNGGDKKIKIFHKKCGHIFEMTPQKFLCGERCKYCSDIFNSKGIIRIKKFLERYNIKYEVEKTFDDCRNPKTKRQLRFDIYIPEYNTIIEYDGEFHYNYFSESSKIRYRKEDLINRQYLDSIKTKYCKDRKINLIRINYKELNNIETILENKFLEK